MITKLIELKGSKYLCRCLSALYEIIFLYNIVPAMMRSLKVNTTLFHSIWLFYEA